MTFSRAAAVSFALVVALGISAAAPSASAGGAIPYDLFVTMEGAPEPVGTGELLTLSITVVNTGVGIADPVLVESAVPDGTVFESASSTNGIVHHPDVGATGPIDCTARNLESGDRVLVKLVVRVVAEGVSAVTATASATGPNDGENDADPEDNTGRTAVPVRIDGASADLQVSIDPDGFSAGTGTPFGFRVVVANRSTAAAASGVILRAATPEMTTLAELETSEMVDRPRPGHRGTVLCQFASIGPGESETVYMSFNVGGTPGRRVELTASASSSAVDPEPDDNVATASVGVVASTTFRLNWDTPDFGSGAAFPPPRHLTATPGSASHAGIGDVAPADARGRTLLACKFYRSARPDVRPSDGTYFLTVPGTATTWMLPAAPGGTFFVITGVYDDGESGPTNEVSVNVPTALLRSVKVTGSKIVGDGSAFSSTVKVFVDGIPFVEPSKLKKNGTRVVQRGALLTGESLATYLGRNPTVLVTFRNENGGVAAWRHPQ